MIKRVSQTLALLCLAFGLQAAEPKGLLSGFQTTVAILETSANQCMALVTYLADTPQQQQRGLMNVERLEPNEAMLFRHRTAEYRSMWMMNTLIPLDMLFIRGDGIISSIEQNTTPHSTRIIKSAEPVNFVLEVNGGFAESHAVKPGNRLLSIF